MAKTQKQSKFQEFLEKHKKAIKIYNILIWVILFIIILAYNSATSNHVTREEMAQQIEEKCSNEVIIPDEAYNVKFTTNDISGLTMCEVITK